MYHFIEAIGLLKYHKYTIHKKPLKLFILKGKNFKPSL
jgi:hypothetical protein